MECNFDLKETPLLLVHLCVKNSRYNFLRKQGYYFAIDKFITVIDLI